MTGELGVVILGAGRVSTAHARATAETQGARLIGVADVDKGRADAFAATWRCEAFTDYADALKRDDVHIVTIALPHHLHERATVDACSAGKHVFIEKPMADTVEECDRMIAAAEKAKVRLFVAHTQRYFASTIKARQILESGDVGTPIFATDTWYKPFGIETRPPWMLDRATGGGMWLMDGAHQIDRTCWVLDGDVESVKAHIGNEFHGTKADDSELAFLRLRNGRHAVIVHTGYAKRGVNKCEVEVACTNGMVRFDSYSNWVQIDQDHKYVPVDVEKVDPFAAEMRNFVAAIQGREKMGVTPQWGRHVVEVLVACEESSRTGREVKIQSRGLEVPVGSAR
ncbi:MAG TPA: Gfo/Idh/MocA family oxidoreductase [Chloroflexota bacterium]|nr:Gfo/Idh/MocA family oxidoreductase [Chloroflexota bacterium]